MTFSLENWAVGVGKNVTLLWENDDQGLASSILSTDFRDDTGHAPLERSKSEIGVAKIMILCAMFAYQKEKTSLFPRENDNQV